MADAHPLDCEGGWIPCWQCMGDGEYHDCGEDSCCCADPTLQDMWPCVECRGKGGWPCRVCEPASVSEPEDRPRSDANDSKSGGGAGAQGEV